MKQVQALALFAAFSATTLASDVYSSFLNSAGKYIGHLNFDVANGGCFNAPGAEKVYFTQASNNGDAVIDGPYCLTAYSDQCNTVTGRQEFSDFFTNGDFNLNGGVANAYAFSWSLDSC